MLLQWSDPCLRTFLSLNISWKRSEWNFLYQYDRCRSLYWQPVLLMRVVKKLLKCSKFYVRSFTVRKLCHRCFHWILQNLSQKVLYKIPVNEYPLYNQIKDFRNTFGKIGCIEQWIKFNNIYDFTCQKTLIQTLFSLFLQPSKAFTCILK